MWRVIFYVDIGTQVQSIVYTIDNSLAFKCYIFDVEWERLNAI